MSMEEFYGWIEYNEYEPLDRSEIQLAQLLTLVNLFMGGSGKFEDFFIGKKKEEKATELSPKAMNDYLKGIF